MKKTILFSDQSAPIKRSNEIEPTIHCIFCRKTFATPFSMQRHETLSHAQEFPHHCSKCRKGFYNEIETNEHENSCQKRCYECYICKLFFLDKSKIIVHMRTYTGEKKPYKCTIPQCNNRYSRKESLSTHMKRKHQ